MTEARVNAQRLWDDHEALAEITEPDRPYTRRSFSPLFQEGRKWLEGRFRDAGLSVRIDAGGNLIGRLEGQMPDSGTIMMGSHSDTVPSGGRFDGISGVLSALEVARCLQEQNRELNHAFEVVDFLAEEASEFGISCVGSRAIVGMLEVDMLAQEFEGETLAQAIRRVGGDPDNLESARRNDITACFELHIEQGPILDRAKTQIGIVSAIVGITRVEISFQGVAGHAGTVPMEGRQDALCAAADMVTWVAKTGLDESRKGPDHFVSTIGALEVSPNAPNVVADFASVIVDARAENHDRMEPYLSALREQSEACAANRHVILNRFEIISDSDPAMCDDRLRTVLAEQVVALGLSSMTMASGAGHDTSFISRIAPSSMVFVPCRDGLSHNPDEWASSKDFAAGTAVLLEAVCAVDRDGIG